MTDDLNNQTSTTVQTGDNLKIHVDPEPSSLRFVLLLILIGAFAVGYAGATLIFALNACSLLGVFVGLVLAAGSIQVAERLLKPRMKSNRYVELGFNAFVVFNGKDKYQAIDPVKEFEATLWWFEITRRTRVPKGWRMVGLALEQDNHYLPVYTLISPEAFEELPDTAHFARLKRQKEMDEQESLRLAGQQRRLMRAETARNMHGLEMLPEDFTTYYHWLKKNFPEWMPKN